MSKPDIAVMLGMPKGGEGEDDGGSESSLSEVKARAEDAAVVFSAAIEAKDAKKIVRAFSTLSTLCAKVDELEESGETPDEESAEEEEPLGDGGDAE